MLSYQDKDKFLKLFDGILSEEQVKEMQQRAHDLGIKLKYTKPMIRGKRAALKKLIEKFGPMCSVCKVTTQEAFLSIDHIIPQQALRELNLLDYLDDEDNYALLCQKCNGMKGKQLDWKHPDTIRLLKKYIQLYEEAKTS
jgi:5-methylcytosine-specific restriction endonuclease McrA